MKSMKSGWMAALTLIFGIVCAAYGFMFDHPALRTALQLLGVIIAALGIFQCQQLVAHWEKMRDEA
jgi:hypothetical protein